MDASERASQLSLVASWMCDRPMLDQRVITPADARPMWDAGLVHMVNTALRRAVLEGLDYVEIPMQDRSLTKAARLMTAAGWRVRADNDWPPKPRVWIRQSLKPSE
jgi:hypothetical protein